MKRRSFIKRLFAGISAGFAGLFAVKASEAEWHEVDYKGLKIKTKMTYGAARMNDDSIVRIEVDDEGERCYGKSEMLDCLDDMRRVNRERREALKQQLIDSHGELR